MEMVIFGRNRSEKVCIRAEVRITRGRYGRGGSDLFESVRGQDRQRRWRDRRGQLRDIPFLVTLVSPLLTLGVASVAGMYSFFERLDSAEEEVEVMAQEGASGDFVGRAAGFRAMDGLQVGEGDEVNISALRIDHG